MNCISFPDEYSVEQWLSLAFSTQMKKNYKVFPTFGLNPMNCKTFLLFIYSTHVRTCIALIFMLSFTVTVKMLDKIHYMPESSHTCCYIYI